MIVIGDLILCFGTSMIFFILGYLFLSNREFKNIKALNQLNELKSIFKDRKLDKKVFKALGYLSIIFGLIIFCMPIVTFYIGNIFYHISFIVMIISTLSFVGYIKLLEKRNIV